jgi:hypothetical protein
MAGGQGFEPWLTESESVALLLQSHEKQQNQGFADSMRGFESLKVAFRLTLG